MWGDPPHVTSHICGPPRPCKQALEYMLDLNIQSVWAQRHTADKHDHLMEVVPQ